MDPEVLGAPNPAKLRLRQDTRLHAIMNRKDVLELER